MRIFLLLFLITLFLGSCTSSSKKETKRVFKLDSITADSYRKLFESGLKPFSFNWKEVEVKVSNEEKRRLIKQFSPWVLEENVDSSHLARVHIMDINNDGKNDFIHTGSGAATYWTYVLIAGQKDTTRFDALSLIANMDIVNKKVKRLYLHSLLATGGPAIIGHSIVDINYDGDSINFIRRLDCENVFVDSLPKTYTVFDIENVKEKSIVRYEPIARNTSITYVLEMPGNHLGSISKGAKATAIGHRKDSLGNSWYLALIWPKYRIKDYIYFPDTATHTYPIVWVSEKEWKRVK